MHLRGGKLNQNSGLSSDTINSFWPGYVYLQPWYYSDVIMSMMASQFTSPTIVYATVYSATYQRKLRSSMPLAFVRGIHQWLVNSPHKGPVTRTMFPFYDVIMMAYGVPTNRLNQCWLHHSCACRIHICNLNLVSAESADVLAPDGARSSAGNNILTTISYIIIWYFFEH